MWSRSTRYAPAAATSAYHHADGTMIKIFMLCLVIPAFLVPTDCSFQSPLKSNLSLVGTLDAEETGPWSSLLEDWATGHKDNRQARIMKLPPTQGYVIANRNDPGFDEWPVKTSPPPGKIINRPPNPYLNKEKPKPAQQREPSESPPRKEVSETDLYLLGAIEKLVYRVDFMEKRLRRMEEMMYYVMAGSSNTPEGEPCANNFTRAGANCYYFGHEDKYDWKTANLVCRKLKGNLVELETEAERQDLLAHIQADSRLRGKDYWTGGLNPGLLWIWSNSARPVPDGNKNASQTISDAQTPNTASASHIHGGGRCLKLAFNPALRGYAYFGFDCAVRQHYICELPDKALSNEIDRLARKLRFTVTNND